MQWKLGFFCIDSHPIHKINKVRSLHKKPSYNEVIGNRNQSHYNICEIFLQTKSIELVPANEYINRVFVLDLRGNKWPTI